MDSDQLEWIELSSDTKDSNPAKVLWCMMPPATPQNSHSDPYKGASEYPYKGIMEHPYMGIQTTYY